MDKQLLQKYFRNQCTFNEIEQIVDWLQTEEGQEYIEKRLDRDMDRYANKENLLLYPDIPSEQMLENIERRRKKELFRRTGRKQGWSSMAMVLLICGVFAGGSYWLLQDSGYVEKEDTEVVTRTISTLEDQQRLVTLSDGTRIRLNANSTIELPENFTLDNRAVRLNGEAKFTVARDENRPFSIHAGRAVVRVLGTEFNVKLDKHLNNVQVAVKEGRVSLSGGADVDGREAILTEDTFAEYQLENGEILIEQTPVDNYLSWISGRLTFHNESLLNVSRYLERLYGVSFRFEEDQMRELSLSVDLMKEDLTEVLDILTQTLDISYRFEDQSRRVTFFRDDKNKT